MSGNRSVVATWIRGWALARGVTAPVAIPGGYRVQVGWPEQQERYVFPGITSVFTDLANTITAPWIFLKVCAPPDRVRAVLPARWAIQSPGYMMMNTGLVLQDEAPLAAGYHLKAELQLPVPVVHILTDGGEIAASGRIALADDFAIYDRIATAAAHRRKGLATAVMKRLTEIACSRGITKGVLVATEEGRVLYETLGWQLRSPYTSAVIPFVK
ncbi:GNAT family N-acetyltransferase [Niabella drilacis]|uniref:Acetyltransferase (GNAT) domain-containing protein n=1 Tax=Niabella drilacis (strain DSM 25811 / CCM 8410 / CCUG 62505 / LMG 26954 / E90) TaxID=1285928 RepID=A0A1G6JVV8_NIADE|nr:GNAT family N-acetyltransferase [Niabella drilacis]SDC22844.1 Acetyltransferase (GNAT) domain-containing protein [Niabella drilacis]